MKRLIGDFHGTVHLGKGVKAVIGDAEGVTLSIEGIGPQRFDDVVVATHGDQALNLLRAPSKLEARILGAFKYSSNRVVLHGDHKLMPRRKSAWASWNFIEAANGRQGVTYWMNLLQNLPITQPVFVTLNPPREPDLERTYGTFNYAHPIFDQGAISAQSEMEVLQGRNHTWFCGSYFGYGFHEDAFASGLRAAEQLDAFREVHPNGRPQQRDNHAHA